MKDDDGNDVRVGDRITFSYGIPPVWVIGTIVLRKRRWVVLTPGHNPPTCRLKRLRKYVGAWFKVER